MESLIGNLRILVRILGEDGHVVGLSVLSWLLAMPCAGSSQVLWAYLNKSNVGGLLTETLSADVEAVFADQTSFVCADSAVKGAS